MEGNEEQGKQQSILKAGEFEGANTTIAIKEVEPGVNRKQDKRVWLLSDKKYLIGNHGDVSPEDVARVTTELINTGASIDTAMMIPGFQGTLAGVIFITSKQSS